MNHGPTNHQIRLTILVKQELDHNVEDDIMDKFRGDYDSVEGNIDRAGGDDILVEKGRMTSAARVKQDSNLSCGRIYLAFVGPVGCSAQQQSTLDINSMEIIWSGCSGGVNNEKSTVENQQQQSVNEREEPVEEMLEGELEGELDDVELKSEQDHGGFDNIEMSGGGSHGGINNERIDVEEQQQRSLGRKEELAEEKLNSKSDGQRNKPDG